MTTVPQPLNTRRISSLATLLADAEKTRVPMEPLTAAHPSLTREDAYGIQIETARRRVDSGARVCGHKIGLTAKPMQEMFGIDEPDYGHLFDDMFLFEETEVSLARFLAPRIEVEPAFVLKRRLEGPGLTVVDILRAIEFVLPALEIIDSRIRDWDIRLADTIADNGSSAALVLGGRPTSLDSFDPRALEVELDIDGKTIERGNTSAILGNPITAVTWLANKLGTQGVALEEGHVVLAGTCIRAIPLTRPAEVIGRFDVLGEVRVRFTS
jgi:2-keto-4-pentenoate hydratase